LNVTFHPVEARRLIDLLLAVLLGSPDATPAASPSAVLPRHLQYRFGWNTKVADSGPLTGTISVDITPASDGGMTVRATESWWNSVRPSATRPCEVYSDGTISCMERPYALSGMDLALFPLLGRSYFDGLTPEATSTWKQHFLLNKGVGVWTCDFTLKGEGAIPNAAPLVLVESSGTIAPQGDRYRERSDTVASRIAYDPIAKLPVLVSEDVTHLGLNTTHNVESVELKLISGQ
jgi:hypothetical protein